MPINNNLAKADEVIFDMIVRAAKLGEPCPGNQEMATATGYKSISTAADAVKRLEAAGRITVERFNKTRTVHIPSLGISTRKIGPQGRTAAMPIRFVRKPEVLIERKLWNHIITEAKKIGRSDAELLGELLWLGWETYCDEAVKADRAA